MPQPKPFVDALQYLELFEMRLAVLRAADGSTAEPVAELQTKRSADETAAGAPTP